MGEGVTLHPEVKQYHFVIYAFRRGLSKLSGFPEAHSHSFLLPVNFAAGSSGLAQSLPVCIGMARTTHLSALRVAPFILTAVVLHEPD